MISPKYLSHLYYPYSHFKSNPHEVNIFLDYNCPFSGKMYMKFVDEVIPKVEAAFPGKFQFVFVNVVQPWHPNSVMLNEFSLAVSQLCSEKDPQLFWKVSKSLFVNKEKFYDTSTVNLTRNEIYEQIWSVVSGDIEMPFSKDQVLSKVKIPTDSPEADNEGNGVTKDVKYFTRYARTLGVHMTPTVSVDGIMNNLIESLAEPDHLVKVFGSAL